jgi:hypothetical protein
MLAAGGVFERIGRHVPGPALQADRFEQPAKAVGCPLIEVQLIRLRFTGNSEAGFHAFQFNSQRRDAAHDGSLGF